MSYIRVCQDGTILSVHEEQLLNFITDDKSYILVVTGCSERSRLLYYNLINTGKYSKCNPYDYQLRNSQSNVSVCSSFNWYSYMSLQLHSAYIHRDATIDFLFKIKSKCRFVPEQYSIGGIN